MKNGQHVRVTFNGVITMDRGTEYVRVAHKDAPGDMAFKREWCEEIAPPYTPEVGDVVEWKDGLLYTVTDVRRRKDSCVVDISRSAAAADNAKVLVEELRFYARPVDGPPPT